MTIECPAAGCGHRYEDHDRASLIEALYADTAAVEVNRRQPSTASCPSCGQVIELGLLVLDDDGVWRTSRFAGHADDVTVMRPPGGSVAYESQQREPSERATGLSAGELKIRDRALAVMEGRAPNVSLDAQREALELALDAGVLGAAEVAGARTWLSRRPG